MKPFNYPALFGSADAASNLYQRRYIRLMQLEYSFLILASILSLSVFNDVTIYAIVAIVIISALFSLIYRSTAKPQQDWYKCRALAESVKTLTWRYVMRAYPFEDSASELSHREEFRENLVRIFRDNKETASKIDPNWSADDQITATMEEIRALPLEQRKAYYSKNRTDEQRVWYRDKAEWNRKKGRNWAVAASIAYIVVVAMVVLRIRFAEFQFWPIDPVIVLASSIVGWSQIKKFAELTAAYTVTAHEIGLIHLKLAPANQEDRLSDFVNEAELAFSREHTLWVARQAN